MVADLQAEFTILQFVIGGLLVTLLIVPGVALWRLTRELQHRNEALAVDDENQAKAADLEEIQRLIGSLTPRESEIFERVCQGQANKVMAIELGISERTVEIHRSQVMHKIGARSLAELVRVKLKAEALEEQA